MVKKQGPPIHSADDKPLSVGQTVYGVDECDGSLTAVKVIDIDTGVKRQVRMRKKNGVEWLWSANASREMCRNREHFVFVEKARAEKHAKVCKAKRLSVDLKNAESDVTHLTRKLKERDSYRDSMKRDLVQAKNRVKRFSARIAALSK